jgi:hypothetical protein
MTEMLLRFVIGGVLVSIFAVLGDLFRPKSFAGLFGAAPSIALATLGLTLWTHGGAYAAIEGRSMMIGALALAIYSLVVCHSTARFQIAALPATLMSLLPWFVVALGLERLLIG